MIGSTCFGHCYAHHQELTTVALITTWAVRFCKDGRGSVNVKLWFLVVYVRCGVLCRLVVLDKVVLYISHSLTPWSRVLLEKLASLQLVKKFPAFYGTRRFLTAFTSARHLALSWASPIQFSYPNPTSWKSILILSSHLRLGLPSGLFPSGFPTSTLYTPLPTPKVYPIQQIYPVRQYSLYILISWTCWNLYRQQVVV